MKFFMGIVVTLFVGLLVFTIAEAWYRGKFQQSRVLYPQRMKAPDGREGNLTSYYPFDILVDINVEATPAEKEQQIRDAMARNPRWKRKADAAHIGEDVDAMYEHCRHWVHCWRWEAKWL